MNGLYGFIKIQPADSVYTGYHLKVSGWILKLAHMQCVVHSHVLRFFWEWDFILCICRLPPRFWCEQDVAAFYGTIKSLGSVPEWPQAPAQDNCTNGVHHVAGWSAEALHQLYVGEKHHHQKGGEEEPVRAEKQLHPQEERQQEEKPSLQQPESPRLMAADIPGWTEEGTVGWSALIEQWEGEKPSPKTKIFV